ncbi:hypothetical protein B0J14DRAFT_35748 [Halenospora varia]|nr:hypothetical protein B0J14DRAFT_35748 [Halenospora varia]
MELWERLKEKVSSRRRTMMGLADSNTTSQPQPQRPASDFEGLSSGRIGSNKVFIEIPPTNPGQVPRIEKPPWYSIPYLFASMNRRLTKIPPPFRPRKHRYAARGTEGQFEPVTPSTNVSIPGQMKHNPFTKPSRKAGLKSSRTHSERVPSLDTDEVEDAEMSAAIINGTEWTVDTGRNEVTTDLEFDSKDYAYVHETSSAAELKPNTLLNTSLSAEAEPPPTTNSSRSYPYNLGGNINPILNSIEELPLEFILEHPDKGSVDHVTTAVLVLTPEGDWKPVKLLFDTGTAPNFASERIVQKYGFPERPILPVELMTYGTVRGDDFTPRKYIEVEVRDEENGIKQKVKFIVAPAKDFDLLAGRVLMTEHNMLPFPRAAKLDGANVITSKKSSKGKFLFLKELLKYINGNR